MDSFRCNVRLWSTQQSKWDFRAATSTSQTPSSDCDPAHLVPSAATELGDLLQKNVVIIDFSGCAKNYLLLVARFALKGTSLFVHSKRLMKASLSTTANQLLAIICIAFANVSKWAIMALCEHSCRIHRINILARSVPPLAVWNVPYPRGVLPDVVNPLHRIPPIVRIGRLRLSTRLPPVWFSTRCGIHFVAYKIQFGRCCRRAFKIR